MINHILKLIWKRRKSSRFLLIEFLGSFLILTVVISILVVYTKNYLQPLGFTYNDKWIVSFLPTDSPDIPETERFFNKWPEMKKQAKEYLLNVDNVIAVSDAPKPNRPFISETGWFDVRSNGQVYRDCLISYADDDYANVMDISVTKGRWFSKEDNISLIRPAVVNLAFAQLVYKKDYPIGEVFLDQDSLKNKIVGVFDKYRYKGDFSSNAPTYFLRFTEQDSLLYNNQSNYNLDFNGMYDGYSPVQADLIVKVKSNTGLDFEYQLYDKLIKQFKNVALKIRPMSEYRDTYIHSTWLPLLLIGLVLGFLIFNSISGLFGVLWYNISLRKSEIGLRMAVGASKKGIYTQFIGEMIALATLGIVPGIIITAQFPILKVFDIETYVYIISMIISTLTIYMLVTICALWPSSQAAKIQPAIALHDE